MKKIRLCSVMLAVALQSGCAASWWQAREDWEVGWRTGTVEMLGTAASFASELPAGCGVMSGHGAGQDGADQLLARVRYTQTRRQHHYLLAVPVGRVVAPGDLVVFQRDACFGRIRPEADVV